ncbi:MAG TPA: hypothetical protein VF339_03805 [Gammaproteobacteria bacterium]
MPAFSQVPDTSSREAFADALTASLLEAADSRARDWENLLDGRVTEVVARSLDRVPLPADKRDEVQALAREKLTEAARDLQERFSEGLKDLLRRAETKSSPC